MSNVRFYQLHNATAGASLDVIDQIEKADSPILECVKLSAAVLKELVRRLDDMETVHTRDC